MVRVPYVFPVFESRMVTFSALTAVFAPTPRHFFFMVLGFFMGVAVLSNSFSLLGYDIS